MKIAVITTVWFPLSHADVIVTRWVEPFSTDATCGWSKPRSVIASAYIEQRPANDIGVKFCSEHDIPVLSTVEQALTLGTGKLAVDGVLLIAEHGDYPRNEFGQKLYPRKRLFDEVVQVFCAFGRGVPVFNDKHFSWDFTESCEMMKTAQELGFPLYGGYSLTHCPCHSHSPIKQGEGISEAVALFAGDAEDYGFHSLEFVQAFLEGRRGGERGIRAVRALEGPAVREALIQGEVSGDLLLNALVQLGYPAEESIIPFVINRMDGNALFQIEHLDGLRVTHLLLPKFISNWVVALRLNTGEIRCCQAGGGKGAPGFFQNFAYLNIQLEGFFTTEKPPTSPFRTHLVTGALQAALRALKEGGRWAETPQLAVAY